MSSLVGPKPPVVMTRPVRWSASLTARRISAGVSPTVVRRTTLAPAGASASPMSALLLSTVNPSKSSLPMATTSKSTGQREGVENTER